MADETENETPDPQDGDAAQAADEQPQDEQPQDEQAPDEQAQEAQAAASAQPETATQEPAARHEPQPAAEASDDAGDGGGDADAGEGGAEAPGADATAAQPAGEKPSSKEIRRKTRSRHVGEARPPRAPEERQAERVAQRAAKALRRRARRAQERSKAAARRAAAPAREPLAPVHPSHEGARRERQGIVVSDRAEKTITVRIDVARRHRRYEKIVRSSSTLHAHDENNEAHVGDVVRVIESRPLSRTKRWRLVDVLERAR